jgi:hypothetical protein
LQLYAAYQANQLLLKLSIVIGLILFASLLPALEGWGQSNLRVRKLPVTSNEQVLENNSLVPGSFVAAGFDTAWYFIDEVKATFRWKRLPKADSVNVQYRVFSFSLSQPAFRYQYDSVASYFKMLPGAKARKANQQDRFMDLGNMTYTGSLGRSLSFGNAQDAVVNSLFNLQMNGTIGDGIQLSAAISDNNIPIQPDGTTQQLNEFDRIWLQFQKGGWRFSIGDIDVREQPTFFLSYFKRLQGLAFETTSKVGKGGVNRTIVSGAIAKGKFTRNVFFGLEGNQGPYRLTGANNELFFVVLAGTERVFMDGKQLQRGEDQDYVINYNTAEIRFTPRVLMTKDLRIQVEFEYADRNFLNSLLYLGNKYSYKDKLEIDLGLYSNADAKNSPINQTLSTTQRQFLSDIGDSIRQALYPSAVLTPFEAGRVLYVKTDTTIGQNLYTIYRFQNTQTAEMYSLSFTEVGIGKGNYRPLLNAANGSVFEWVAPLNGEPQGSFEPVLLLVTPKKQQMATAGIGYVFNKYTKAKVEAGYSYTDINTFSAKDAANNGGLGLKATLSDVRTFTSKSVVRNVQSEVHFEKVSENFRALERLRTVEFLRDWGLPFDAGFASEQLLGGSVRLSQSAVHQLRYDFTNYQRGTAYSGSRHTIDHSVQARGWSVKDILQYTRIRGNVFNGYFLRPSVLVGKQFAKWKQHEIGGSFALEHNELRSAVGDTLTAGSFSFRDWRAFFRSDATKKNRWSLQWFQRANSFPLPGGFVPLDVNNNYNLLVDLFKNPRHQFRLNTGYRTLQVKTPGITNQQSDRTLLARGEYFMNIAKGAITGNVLYETGAGQEQQRNFSFVEVPAGRGEFTWIDFNNDGVQQLNEFEVAQFPDQARFIRIFTPTNQFVKAAYNAFNISFVFTPANVWRRDSSDFKRFLSRWNLQASLQTNSKKISDGGLHLNPINPNMADSGLISLSTNLANTISYNRFSTKWGVDVTQVRNNVRALLTYGFETRLLNDYLIRLRRNFGRAFTLLVSAKTGSNSLITPNPKFDNRNFKIETFSLSPSFTYTKGAVFRSQVLYRYDKKEGTSTGIPQQSITHSVQWESKYNLVQKGIFTGRLTYTGIQFDGTPNSTVSFIMLEGLQAGQNYLWSFDFTRRLANALDLSFQYEGRKAGDTRVIHIGRASLRALL